jgi:threonine dehydratase
VSAPLRLGLAEIERARRVVAAHLPPTPLRRCRALRSLGDVRLKLECLQPTGSFKVRGALNALDGLAEAGGRRGVVAASAGNHALGVAFAAGVLGGRLPVTVVVPETAPRAKVEKLRPYPVRVLQRGTSYDDAFHEAQRLVRATGAACVHAFDDPATAAGQGTVGLEILDALPEVGLVVVPLGGGGLLAGLAVAVKSTRPDVRIVGVQAEASPSWRESLRAGRALVEYPAGPTLADGIAGGVGELVFAHRRLVDDVVLVSEVEMEQAVAALLREDEVQAEASGAAGVAALRCLRVRPDPARSTVAVVTGANIDHEVLARILARSR